MRRKNNRNVLFAVFLWFCSVSVSSGFAILPSSSYSSSTSNNNNNHKRVHSVQPNSCSPSRLFLVTEEDVLKAVEDAGKDFFEYTFSSMETTA